MKLNVIHPSSQSLAAVGSAISQGEQLYRSPHVGNVNGRELSLLYGINAMGGAIQLELVDTIRGDDKYANPRVAQLGDQIITLASRNYAKSRIVGACNVTDEALGELMAVGVVPKSPKTLKDLHVDTLRQAVPEATKVTVSTQYFSSIGRCAYELVLSQSLETLSKPIRNVTADGKFQMVTELDDTPAIYGLEGSVNQGLIPPLEGMMAAEVIKKVMDGTGPDMIRYTKCEEVMEPVRIIASKVLAELGIGNGCTIDYVVPCMAEILQSNDFDTSIPSGVNSQYDILMQRAKG